MIKLNQFVAIAVAAYMLAGSASAATLTPAAGEAPYFDGRANVAVTSQLQRQTVADEAAAHPPAAGNRSARDPAPFRSVLSRAQVLQSTAQAGEKRDGFPAASGEQNG